MNGSFVTTTKLHGGESLLCPMCGSDDFHIAREKGQNWNYFRCHNCKLYSSETAVRMSTGVPICHACFKPLHKLKKKTQAGAWWIHYFICAESGCTRQNQEISTLQLFEHYEKWADRQRQLEQERILEGHLAAKKSAVENLEQKMKAEKDGKDELNTTVCLSCTKTPGSCRICPHAQTK